MDPVTGESALCIAVANRKIEIVRLLLNRGAKVNVASNYGLTPLMRAVHSNTVEDNTDIVDLLLGNGANPNSFTKTGLSALDFVLGRKQLSYVDMLIKHGAKLNQRNKFGKTVLTRMIDGRARNSIDAASDQLIDYIKKLGAKE